MEKTPFCTKVYQSILMAVLVTTVFSAIVNVFPLEEGFNSIAFFGHIYMLIPFILAFRIWQKIYGENATRLNLTGIKIGRIRLKSSDLVYWSSLMLLYVVLAVLFEIIPQTQTPKSSLWVLLDILIKNSPNYAFSVFFLHLLAIHLSFSLGKEVYAEEHLLAVPFLYLTIGSILNVKFHLNLWESQNFLMAIFVVCFLIIPIGLSLLSKIEKHNKKPIKEYV